MLEHVWHGEEVPPWDAGSQSVSHYHTPSREHMAHTHSLLWSSFSSVRRVSLHLPMQMHLLLSSGRSSYFRMVFCSFHFLPIFLLAQILMRADLGDEPEHPLEVVISNPPGQDAPRTPQLTGNVGQRSLHSARISEETREMLVRYFFRPAKNTPFFPWCVESRPSAWPNLSLGAAAVSSQ